ncbi:hypothetical protein ABH927_005076 [Planotetraspora sp. GP83]
MANPIVGGRPARAGMGRARWAEPLHEGAPAGLGPAAVGQHAPGHTVQPEAGRRAVLDVGDAAPGSRKGLGEGVGGILVGFGTPPDVGEEIREVRQVDLLEALSLVRVVHPCPLSPLPPPFRTCPDGKECFKRHPWRGVNRQGLGQQRHRKHHPRLRAEVTPPAPPRAGPPPAAPPGPISNPPRTRASGASTIKQPSGARPVLARSRLPGPCTSGRRRSRPWSARRGRLPRGTSR